MTRMTFAIALLMLLALGSARADVLCQKASGVVVVRDVCRRRETALDFTRFVGVGPQGPQGPRGPAGVGPLTQCPPDEVRVGPTCVDEYEASTWQIDPSNSALVAKVQDGTVTLADLTAAGATPLCDTPGDENFPSTFPASGQWTSFPGANPPSPGVYAVSVAGAIPSQCTTWFQAAQACRLSGKRLLTNLEWQDAAAGTPDPGTDNGTTDCSVATYALVPTGSRSVCVSAWGAFDMVGNVDEWVADWADMANANGCRTWTSLGYSSLANDSLCFGGSGDLADSEYSQLQGIPAALRRGIDFTAAAFPDPQRAGVFSLSSRSMIMSGAGFRCGR